MEKTSKGKLWTGRIISGICVLFFLFDAGGKLFREAHSVTGTTALGFPDQSVTTIGAILLICTIIYLIPRTTILGALLITGYLGGALASMLRAGLPFYFPIVFGILFWVGLYLRDSRARALLS